MAAFDFHAMEWMIVLEVILPAGREETVTSGNFCDWLMGNRVKGKSEKVCVLDGKRKLCTH